MTFLLEKTLHKDSYALHYYTAGSPTHPAIIFLHPAYGDHTCFHHQVKVFSETYHLILLDMPGHGRSQVGVGTVTIDKTTDLVAEILDIEGHQTAHLVGVSLGSLIAQAIAVRSPERVKSVTVVGGYSIFGDNAAITQAQNREIGKALFLLVFWMDGFRRYVVKNTNVVEAERRVFYQAMQCFTRRSFPVLSGMQKILDKTPRTIPQPLLIAIGEHDLPLILSHAQNWQQREPDGRLQVIAGAGHCANMDMPQEFNQQLLDFLASQA